jgi:glycosyltransferase involved in cell wall biosynthesis
VFAVELGDALSSDGRSVRTVALAPGTAEHPLGLPALGRTPLGLSTLRALRRDARRVDVVVAHGSRTLPACALALPATGVPFVYRNIGDPTYWSGHGWPHARTRVFLSRAAAVVALTDGAATTLRDRYHVAQPRLTVIPTAVSAARHAPATPAARRAARVALTIPFDAPVAAVIGALSPEKGVGLAIDAVAQTPGVHLIVAGDGRERDELEVEARRVASGRVHFTGTLADPSLAFDAADVVVLGSRTEGLPSVLIEAGLRGLPAVATDVGYVRDVVIDGETGAVVTAGDVTAFSAAITRVLETQSAMGERARQHCLARFELASAAMAWAAALEQVARSPLGLV